MNNNDMFLYYSVFLPFYSSLKPNELWQQLKNCYTQQIDILHPAAGSYRTQRLGTIGHIRWVR